MKFLRGMFHLISWIWTAAVLYSLKQFVTMIAYSVEIWPGEWRYQGFSVNRLFGIFNDPNYAGVTSFYVILMLIFLFKNSKNKILKVLCISACVLHAVYIVLSGSRTAAICTVAVSFCVSFFLIRNRCRSDKAVKANLLSCFIAGICAVCIVGAGILLREGLPHIPKIYAEFVLNNQTENSSSVTTGDEENVEQLIAQSVSEADENTFLQRKDVESSTHTRQRIWKNYLQGLRGRYIIGASPRNIDKYMEDAHPDIYDQNEGYETHNGFLSVFAGTGIVGLSVVFIYIVLITRKIGVYCFQYTKIDENFLLILSVIMCILIYTCFFTELFFVNNLTTVIFWTLLGTLMYWLKDDEVNTKVK